MLVTTILILTGYASLAQENQEVEAFRDSLYDVAERLKSKNVFDFYIDSLHKVASSSLVDSIRATALVELSNSYKYSRPDSAVFFARRAIEIGQKDDLKLVILNALSYYMIAEINNGNYAKGIHLALQKIKLAEDAGDTLHLAAGNSLAGYSYFMAGQLENAIPYYRKALSLFRSLNNETFISINCAYLADAHSALGDKDSAIYYSQESEAYNDRALWTEPFLALHNGRVYAGLEYYDKAFSYFHYTRETGYLELFYVFEATMEIAGLHWRLDNYDSAYVYGRKALEIANELGSFATHIQANQFLFKISKTDNPDLALEYSENASRYKDSLTNAERLLAMEDFEILDAEQRQRELREAQEDFRYRLRMNALLGSSFTLLVVALVLFRSRRQKQKSKEKIEEAYDQLKSTQSQLIHSEKMASLGELTAGIAHEIQNPLNFVNNFSDINKELIEDLKEAISNNDQEEVNALLGDLLENEDKVLHHGKRAEEIVRSMLQHSRGSEGVKEPTDINALCDEYLRLAFHGLRAKDKSFNADFELNPDDTIPRIEVVPQDIGRVLLNLINNAFQAVSSKAKSAGDDYKPKVVVTTRKTDQGVEISVRDNGSGIPEEIKEKIFQPFFTTKPTGQGTGLGLSMSYDIVTKGHGGELKVNTVVGQGSEFILILTST